MTPPRRPPRRPVTWAVVTILLAASLVATLWVPSYSRTAPALGGFPFFYWYQLIWVPIVALLSAAAYFLTRRASRGSGPSSAHDGGQRSSGSRGAAS